MNIDKDINRCKELIKTEHSNWIGMSNQDAISNVLIDRETWKKIAEKLAEEMALHGICSGVEESDKCYANEIQCKQCIIDWAKREVLKDE